MSNLEIQFMRRGGEEIRSLTLGICYVCVAVGPFVWFLFGATPGYAQGLCLALLTEITPPSEPVVLKTLTKYPGGTGGADENMSVVLKGKV